MELTWLLNNPALMVALGLALVGIILLLAIVINLARCRQAVLQCRSDLDLHTSQLKSQTDYLEGLDLWMQHFNDHLIKRMKIPSPGAKQARLEKAAEEEAEIRVIE
jgi:hypothetical protein